MPYQATPLKLVIFTVTITDGNSHRFLMVIDPEGVVNESSKFNNIAIKALYPEQTYDFDLHQISISPDPVDIFQNATISTRMNNHGTTNAYQVPVKYYIVSGNEAIDIATRYMDIPAGASIALEITWWTNRGRNLTVFAQVDPENAFDELSEGNHEKSNRPYY